MQAATPGMWATGIVALHNANDSGDGLAFRTYQELRRRDELGLRVLQQFPVCNLDHLRAIGLRSGLGDAWLRVGGIKMFADGALGSRTASMLQPYVDEPNNWGVAATDPEEMLEQALAASAAGLSLTIHAIGDRANRDVLNVLAEVRRQEASQRIANGESANRRMVKNNAAICHKLYAISSRHRIEHVQCIHPDDLPRLAQLDVIASVQPIHATSDMRIVDRYWGPDARAGRLSFPPAAGQRRPAGLRLRRPDRAARAADRHPRRGDAAPRAMARRARRVGKARNASLSPRRSMRTPTGRPTPRARKATAAASRRAKWPIWWCCRRTSSGLIRWRSWRLGWR